MTPYELNILLHYHTRVVDYGGEGEPISSETIQEFVIRGLLVPRIADPSDPRCYLPTPRLHAFCEMLCAVPLPVQVWVHPDKFPSPGIVPDQVLWEIEKEKAKSQFLYGK